MLAACASALVFGLFPALRSSGVDLLSVMKDDFSPRGAARGRFRMGLVVSQVAVSLLLLIGGRAGHAKSRRGAKRRPGIRRHQRGLVENRCLAERIRRDPRARAFFAQLLDRLRADPGTASATLAMNPPLTMVDPGAQTGDHRRLRALVRDEDLTFLSNIVAPDYFRTLNIGLIAGREFEEPR